MASGIFLGRFQPFHNGHLEMVAKAQAEVDELIIVIGSAEKSFVEDNPFTAGERMTMILETIALSDWENIIVVPIRDLGRYGLWVHHLEDMLPKFSIVFSSDGPTIALFQEKGYRVKTFDMKNRQVLSGTAIREIMALGNPTWEEHVPLGTKKVINEIEGVDRVKHMRR